MWARYYKCYARTHTLIWRNSAEWGRMESIEEAHTHTHTHAVAHTHTHPPLAHTHTRAHAHINTSIHPPIHIHTNLHGDEWKA